MTEKFHSDIEEYVINIVRQRRIENGMSQSYLASLLGLSKSFLADIETPKSRAKYNLNHINQLAKIFECSPKDFLPEQPFGEL